MSYAVEADLNLSDARLVELTDSADAVGEKDDALIARLLVEAEAEVDAALFDKYSVPFSTVPVVIKYITADIWRLNLYEHREVMEVPESVQASADQSRKKLRDYAMGVDSLNAARATAGDVGSSVGSFSADSDYREFGREKDGPY